MDKKIIILDFDGTLYSGENIFCYTQDYIDRNRRKFLTKISDSDYEMVCANNPIFMNAIVGSEIIREIFNLKKKYPNLVIDTKDFVDCQENEVYDINLSKAHFVDVDFINNLCSKYSVYVVSNSSIRHIRHYMLVLGINPSIFKGIISNQFEDFDPTKKHYYQEIIKNENISPSQLYVFGDSLNSDLKPAIEIGANAFLSEDAQKLNELIEKSLNN